MPIHAVIEPLSNLWWSGIIVAVLSVLIIPFTFKKVAINVQNKFEKAIGISSILIYVITIVLAINLGDWTIQNFLPLHLCTISYFICILVLLNKKQWLYEWGLFIAVPSGLHSVLTPELSMGISDWYLFEYYFVHIFLMVVPLYLTIAVGMRPRISSWWKTFLRVQIGAVIIFPLNFIIDTNYMFLAAKPLVENPLLIGDWPFYILFLELFVFLHIVLIYKLTPKQV
jgi:hypothetical integral membrane protein (TIGR02206 family)